MSVSIKRSKKWFNLLLAVLGLGMVAVSVYLTDHYFQLFFPKTLNVGTFCNISAFWNCDTAAFSPLGSIFNVPTSIFGIAFGFIIVFGALIKKPFITKTNYFVAIVNLLACIFLLGYSLVFLGGLCPGCTIYYALSLITVLVFGFMSALLPVPKFSVLLSYGIFLAALMSATYAYNHKRFKEQDEIFARFAEQMLKQPIQDESAIDFFLPIVQSTKDFSSAPVRVTIFSDFQCPFCKILGSEIEKIAKHYSGNINVRYVFFPLDNSCNSMVQTDMHPLACDAARLSFCAQDHFVKIHDEIYDHQEKLSKEWLINKAKSLQLADCYNSEETKSTIKTMIEKTKGFAIDGAPTVFINGRRISGLLPAKALMVLFDALLEEQKNLNNSN